MSVLIDGKRMLGDIATAVKMTPQAVGQFLIGGAAVELIEYQRGKPPRRLLDYVPPEWLTVVEMPGETDGSTGDSQATLPTQNK